MAISVANRFPMSTYHVWSTWFCTRILHVTIDDLYRSIRLSELGGVEKAISIIVKGGKSSYISNLRAIK